MTGDGLTDIVLAHDGDVSYWPYQGYGSWGAKVMMRNPPRFADAASYAGTGFDPGGCCSATWTATVAPTWSTSETGPVTVWINQAGNGFAAPVTIRGTPPAAGAALRLADLTGSGISGVLWSYGLGSVNGLKLQVPRPHRREPSPICSTGSTTTRERSPRSRYSSSAAYAER